MKRDGGLVEAMGGCRPPTPAAAAWVRASVSVRESKRACVCACETARERVCERKTPDYEPFEQEKKRERRPRC